MKDLYKYGLDEAEPGLAELEPDFPNIRRDFEQLLTLLESKPFSLGERIDPSDRVLEHVSWTPIHHTGRGSVGRSAGILIYQVWRDENAYHIQLLAVLRGSAWKALTAAEMKTEVRKLVSPP